MIFALKGGGFEGKALGLSKGDLSCRSGNPAVSQHGELRNDNMPCSVLCKPDSSLSLLEPQRFNRLRDV